jgi:alpha-galactosidase
MEMLVDTIQSNGMEAGIWTAPFLASAKSAVLGKHPDWVCRDRRGKPLRANWNPIGWGGWALALDTTNPAVLDHLRQTFSTLKERGWTYHKIDFLYAAAMPATRSGQDKYTRAEALAMGIQAVRDGIGDDAYLLGCGCPLAQAVGIVDAMRVSPDTAALWSTHSLRLPGYPDTVPSLRSSLRMSLLRAPLHRRLWVNDPDCILVRDTRTRLTPRERRIGAQVIAATGGLRIVSDDLATYGDKEWELIEEINSTQKMFDRKLRILDPFAATLKIVPESTEANGMTPGDSALGVAGDLVPGAAGNSALGGYIPGESFPGGSTARSSEDQYPDKPSLHADVLHMTGKSAHTKVIIPPKKTGAALRNR